MLSDDTYKMARLLDRSLNEMMQGISKRQVQMDFETSKRRLDFVKKLIDADLQEEELQHAKRKSAHWIYGKTEEGAVCSACGLVGFEYGCAPGYCPNCGAKMDEEEL